MSFQVRSESRPNTMGLDGTVWLLWNAASGAGAEVWPALGFNCYRWQAPCQGHVLDLLYADPKLFQGARWTRSGVPVLFPFPNRIREGRFSWQGKDYQLPLKDSTGKNAIHGFACRKAWRIADHGADAASAWVTGEFVGGRDAPELRDCWPADYSIRVTYRLTPVGLRIETVVANPDRVPLPFGLGFHPYFRVPFLPGRSQGDYLVECPARQFWELADSLPTSHRRPVDIERDLTSPRSFPDLSLDDLYTGIDASSPGPEGLVRFASLRQASDGIGMEMRVSPAFREAVIFTPPHREAICLEPYTCPTDAINLQSLGIDAGLIVLAPGGEWRGIVEMAAPVVAPAQ